jgi:hypothetical protein
VFTAIQLCSHDNELAHNAKSIILSSLLLMAFKELTVTPNAILIIKLAYKIDRQYYYLFLTRVLPRYLF